MIETLPFESLRSSSASSPRILSTADWARLISGLALVFGLFHWWAAELGSDRGQSGWLVAIVVVAATIAADQVLLRRPRAGLVQRLGLGRPSIEGLVIAAGVALPLLLPAFLWIAASGTTVTFYPRWLALLPGLFAQAGVAEEVLFRAYLFGNVREGRTFWRAATLSALPFVGVHLVLFMLLPWPVALGSVALSVVGSFPLAYLFELGGRTIWAPAFLHFVLQAVPKVLVFSDRFQTFVLIWIIAGALVPLLVFARKTD